MLTRLHHFVGEGSLMLTRLHHFVGGREPNVNSLTPLRGEEGLFNGVRVRHNVI